MPSLVPVSSKPATKKNLQRSKLDPTKPVMNAEVEVQVESAIAQYKNVSLWNEWGMKFYRKQGSCILLYGPSGTGKTVISRYLAEKVGHPLKEVDVAVFGSGIPGENERNIEKIFAEGKAKRQTLYFNECEAILWDRSNTSKDNMWMLAVIDKLLVCLEEYPHLVIMSTNREMLLDTALERRIIAKVKIERPDYQSRKKLWAIKVPRKFPLQLSPLQIEELATLNLSGAEIENTVIMEAQRAITEDRLPNYDSLCNIAKTLAN